MSYTDVRVTILYVGRIHRLAVVLKVETDIIGSNAASPIGRAMVLMLMFVEIFKTDHIVFIGNVIICLTSY